MGKTVLESFDNEMGWILTSGFGSSETHYVLSIYVFAFIRNLKVSGKQMFWRPTGSTTNTVINMP